MNATIMEKILDTRYRDGGALLETMPSGSSVTIYLFVYVPETLDIYSKGPDL